MLFHLFLPFLRLQEASYSPTPSNQPLQWKTFISSDKSFSIQFPTEPIRECDTVKAPNGKIKVIEYISKSKDMLFAVMYGDCPSNALSGLTPEQILDVIKNHAIENVRQSIE